MMAMSLPGIPVVAGRKRSAAIKLLLKVFPDLQVIIMDDAFQHAQVCRDVDIVCFDSLTGVGNGWLIPAGYLREPLSSLRRAQFCVINHKHDDLQSNAALTTLLSRFHPDLRHCVSGKKVLLDEQNNETELTNDVSCVLVSGIANPKSLEHSAQEAGIRYVRHFSFPDHHPFTSATEIADITRFCKQQAIRHIVCTAKDMPKLAMHHDLHGMLFCLELSLQDSENGKLWLDIARSIGYD